MDGVIVGSDAGTLNPADIETVSISDGSNNIKTYTSVGVYDEDGAVKGYDYTRYNLRFNVDCKAID